MTLQYYIIPLTLPGQKGVQGRADSFFSTILKSSNLAYLIFYLTLARCYGFLHMEVKIGTARSTLLPFALIIELELRGENGRVVCYETQ